MTFFHPEKKVAGILFPLFALKGKHDLGVGDTSALVEALHWAFNNHFSLIQILPINEMFLDYSPYNPLSAFALDITTIATLPQWISELSEASYHQIISQYDVIELTSGLINYSLVKKIKSQLLREAWKSFCLEKRDDRENDFKKFIDQNSDWLPDYTLYKVFLEKNNGTSFHDWLPEERTLDGLKEILKKLSPKSCQQIEEERLFFSFIQWIAFSQWKTVADIADSLGIGLVGDISFGMSPQSADVFTTPNEFELELSMGAPAEKTFNTDVFTTQWGQNWGFPPYRWDEMAKNDFSWWRRRLRVARTIFHFLRIDHILGFFRVYTFPWFPQQNHQFTSLSLEEVRDKTGGKLPCFKEYDDSTENNCNYNMNHGKILLKILAEEVGNYRIIGENLGLVPYYVTNIMHANKMISYTIPQWEKNSDGNQYARLSLATYTTHDHPPIGMQWEKWNSVIKNKSIVQQEIKQEMEYLNNLCVFAHINPTDLRWNQTIHRKLIQALLDSNSWLVIINITDLFDSRYCFNCVSAFSHENWKNRIPIPIHQWQDHYLHLLDFVSTTISKSNRIH